jgi:hypothetical protein
MEQPEGRGQQETLVLTAERGRQGQPEALETQVRLGQLAQLEQLALLEIQEQMEKLDQLETLARTVVLAHQA